jgi:ATP-dependent Clp protease ATP-binding subunit ClpA
MFERYTEKARRAIFFARYEASQFGSSSIETEHLLLGLLREDKALAHRFLGTTSSESIRKQVEARVLRGSEVIPTSVDLPMSHECKRVLAYGAEETERLKHKHIHTEHMLLGLLREEKSLAAAILREQGLQLLQVRDKVASGGDAPSRPNGGEFRIAVGAYLAARQKEWAVAVVIAPRVGSLRPDIGVYEPTPDLSPFVCIEVLSPDDRFVEFNPAHRRLPLHGRSLRMAARSGLAPRLRSHHRNRSARGERHRAAH